MAERTDIMSVGEIEVRPHEHAVLVGGQEVVLSSREFSILCMLAEHPGWVYSIDQLSGESERSDYSPESVSVLVSRLRHKLAEAGAPDAIDTVRGLGYRLHSHTQEHEDSRAVADATRELREASWHLVETVIDVMHTGTLEQLHAVIDVVERARRAIYTILAK